MAENSGIEWTDHTFNPWIGCTKVSPACDHCYAERVGLRLQVKWGSKEPRKRTSESNWNEPRRWNARAAAAGKRERVFCASLADVFDNEVPEQWRFDLFALIAETPNLDWLILTKRIGNVDGMSRNDGLMFDLLRERVWLGISVVTQAEVDRDVPKLIAVPAAKRFLSCEPLLEPINLFPYAFNECPNFENVMMDPETGSMDCCRWCDYTGVSDEMGVDWVIVGGESGPGARPMHPDWARSLRDQCASAEVPFFFKQWGEWAPCEIPPAACASSLLPLAVVTSRGRLLEGRSVLDELADEHAEIIHRIGKKAAGSDLDGVQHKAMPA